jgi:hypothetical protein
VWGSEADEMPATTRDFMEKDATASYSDKEMHAALDINIPNYASAMVTTTEIVDSISSL